MTSGHLNPAIYAGVAGALAWGTPVCAQALTVLGQDVPLPSADNPATAFVAGCAVGALVASGTSLAITRATSARGAAGERVSNAPQVEASVSASDAHFSASVRNGARASAGERNATGHGIASPTDDYADVAEAYVRNRTVTERMRARAKGVAGVLSERLAASRMDGIPVIERADGSVADMGESWWDEALASREEERLGAADVWTPEAAEPAATPAWGQGRPQPQPQPQPVAPSWVEPAERDYPAASPSAGVAPVSHAGPAASAHRPSQMPSRDLIAARVPSLSDDGPQSQGQRWGEERQDLWAIALEALDERYQEQIDLGPEPDPEPVFSDDLGGEHTLDEPDGLERSTKFMTFRPQAGHPEVTDSESYVNLLIRQEFAKSRSAHRLARKTFREHLKVIDGGTGEEPTACLGARHLVAQA